MMPGTGWLIAAGLLLPGLLRAQDETVVGRYDAKLHELQADSSASYNVASYNLASSPSFHRAVVHWGKWLFAGAAAALTVMGAHEHENSNHEWDRLLAMCRADNADCQLGPSGAYLNPAAEQLYQSSLHFDRRARTRLLAGQGALLLAAGLFIADLRRHPEGPANKPLGKLEVAGNGPTGGVRVGLRLAF